MRALFQRFKLCTSIIPLLVALSGCANNGEAGFNNHPLDCAIGFYHNDCLPGTAGYNKQFSSNNTQKTPAQQAWQTCYGSAMLKDRSNSVASAAANAAQACGPYPQN